VIKARQAAGLIHALERRLPAALVEASALAGALSEAALVEQASGQGFAQRIADRLSLTSDERWSGARADDGALVFLRWRGERQERFRLDPQIARSPEARRLVGAMADLLPVFQEAATLERAGRANPEAPEPARPARGAARPWPQGLSIQRYKGLGEIDPGSCMADHARSRGAQPVPGQIEHADGSGQDLPRRSWATWSSPGASSSGQRAEGG
jgi:hypothetical protein